VKEPTDHSSIDQAIVNCNAAKVRCLPVTRAPLHIAGATFIASRRHLRVGARFIQGKTSTQLLPSRRTREEVTAYGSPATTRAASARNLEMAA
jgi:hypothetical protein